MSDDFTDLENELKQLRPKSVPAALIGRIATDLDQATARPGLFASWRSWILPVAASLALAVTVTSIPFLVRDREVEAGSPAVSAGPGQVAKTSTDRPMKPVHATNVLYDAVNEGIVYLDGKTPVRRMRLNYLDTITWENPNGGSSLKWTIPREEIYFIPVAAN